MAFAVHPHGSGWSVALDDGSSLTADAVVLTCPMPQNLALAITAFVELPDELRGVDYDRTLALLTVLDGPPAVPPPGGVQPPDGTFAFVGDNHAKGVSDVPAVTFHAEADWSARHWDDDREEIEERLRADAAPWLGSAGIVAAQVKRWRYATPKRLWPERCWRAPTGAPLVLAGDAFAGPRVEGAACSGLAAAEAVVA
jgi:predicted NAD/FAD-dependent oxidoreductase